MLLTPHIAPTHHSAHNPDCDIDPCEGIWHGSARVRVDTVILDPHIALAREFEAVIQSDERGRIIFPVKLLVFKSDAVAPRIVQCVAIMARLRKVLFGRLHHGGRAAEPYGPAMHSIIGMEPI